MAKRGEGKTQKAISAPKIIHLNRKEKEFVYRTKAGAHSKETAVPLGFCLREILGVGENNREIKKIVFSGNVKVNGVTRKRLDFNVGLFDVIEIPKIKKGYRAVIDKKGRLKLKETSETAFKISRVEKKHKKKGGKVVATTNDGFNIEVPEKEVNVWDSIKISLPEKKFLGVYKMEEGNSAFVVDGSHVGTTAKIIAVNKGGINRKKSVELQTKDEKFITVAKNVFVVGKNEAEMQELKGE